MLFRFKNLIVSGIVLMFLLLLSQGFSLGLAQSAASHLSYQPSAEEITKYGPGFPAYCSAYESRPECIAIYGSQPIPVESDPCYLTGGYQQGCVPTQQYPCLPGDPSPNCLPQYAPTIIPVPVPMPLPLPVPPPIYITPPPALNVYDFRLETPVPTPSCQYGYSPHCLAIATMKAFDHSYAISPAIPSYRVGETLEYRINSPYTGYLYVFVEEPDRKLKVLYPNAYTGDAPYIPAGTVLDLPGLGAQYSLDVTAPYGLHKLFFLVTTRALPDYLDENVHSQADLDTILLDLGLTAGIYHGYGETAFNVVY